MEKKQARETKPWGRKEKGSSERKDTVSHKGKYSDPQRRKHAPDWRWDAEERSLHCGGNRKGEGKNGTGLNRMRGKGS